MQHSTLPFRDTHSFSDFFLDYIEQKDKLKPFYQLYPTRSNFKSQIEAKQKSFPKSNRQVLVGALQNQYSNLDVSEKVKNNIDSLLSESTFTVTTGHQLNIFTGPLYFIYKIVSVINACKKLKEDHPHLHFVPVYWMASEDHDYEEIKSFRLYGKKYTWTSVEKGAVGRFSTRGLDELLKDMPGDVSVFKEAYLKSKTLADAVRSYVNALFENEGLVVVDADHPGLKKQFIEVMQEDIFDGLPARKVNETSKKLESLGYHVQVHARDINFFYLDQQLRVRLEKQGDEFVGVDSNLHFSKADLFESIKKSPEKFSPNVILRPIYQEMILPNLAYVGGPAELVYWLQLKEVFDNYEVPFPVLMPRNFALIIDTTIKRKLEKTGLEIKEYFESKNYLFNHWVTQNTHHNLSLGAEMNQVKELFETLKQRAVTIDKTLEQLVDANSKRVNSSLEVIEKKFLKAEKRRHSDKLRQIEAVKDALFPNGSLQERTDNFLNFYQQDRQFISKLLNYLDPFDFKFNMISYE